MKKNFTVFQGGDINYVFFSWITDTDKYGTAQRALIAKYTFNNLTENDKQIIVKVALQILEFGGYPDSNVEAWTYDSQDTCSGTIKTYIGYAQQ